MPAKDTHLGFGVVLSVGMSVLLNYFTVADLQTTIGYAVVGGFWGSIFADLVEPPSHYTHRGFFHSVRLGKYLLLTELVSLIVSLLNPTFWFLFYGCFGYTLHLLADAMTPMKLPE